MAGRDPQEVEYKGTKVSEILSAHEQWLAKKGGKRADFSSANLTDLNLRGVKLFKARFFRANLSGSDLREADLRRTDLRGAMLGRCKLTRSDLSGAIASEANFRGAVLRAANISGADLRKADLRHADLYSSNLSESRFTWANLAWAKLSRANMTKTWLVLADLSYAELRETRFFDAVIGMTRIGNCNLSKAQGLETIRHVGPSSIGIDTILRSNAQIPVEFLRGAGVPQSLITYFPSLVGRAFEFYSCFISYADEDIEFAEKLFKDLRRRRIRCWLFREHAKWGESVWGEIDRSIRLYDKLVVVCSQNSLQSGPVIREIERALQKEDREKRNVLFPIRIDDYLFDEWKHERKADVVSKVVGDFRGWKDHDKYSYAFGKLLSALNKPQES